MSRVLIVSNRLPVTVTIKRGRVTLSRSSGGLATGLGGVHRAGDSLWIGWPGITSEAAAPVADAMLHRLGSKMLVGVPLSASEVETFYEGFANEVLWPTFHYLLDMVPMEAQDWDLYERVNERFAEVVASHYRPGDLVWVHDYHLMRVPALLRRRIPDARIAFFLHIPFPPSDLFRTLPGRRALLEGLLGADLIGFHTAGYLRHFTAALLRLLGLTVEIDRVRSGGREVRMGIFPMGIDAQHYDELVTRPDVANEAEVLRAGTESQILVGIDRLDYTKGIPRRLLAFERLLERHPELHGKVRLIQVASPSRSSVRSYREYRHHVNELIGRIHGAFATPSWVPVHYIHRGFSETQVAALYRAADVMLVTPIRDGMNLVAKEFVASRRDGDGVLVLSEFAGAQDELLGALLVNPYDIDQTAETFHRALTMELPERVRRMEMLRARVFGYDVHRWARELLAELANEAPIDVAPTAHAPAPLEPLEVALERARRARHLALLLDYDGTLVPLAPTPGEAEPDPELISLLVALAARPATEVHIVSGRPRQFLERWFGPLPVFLHAEHGLISRGPGSQVWRSSMARELGWRERVERILRHFAERTPGAFVEVKEAGLAWHWRLADPEFGARQADELHHHLIELLASSPATVLVGDKVVEVRPVGVRKGQIVQAIADRHDASDTAWIALGDDATDEELFAALPDDAVSIHVGDKPSVARYRVADVAAVRRLLRDFLPGPT